MTITAHPVIGYQNLIDAPATVLSSAHVAAGSDVRNIQDPNLGVVLDLGTGTSRVVTADLGSVKSVGGFMVRMRDGWEDLESLRVEASVNSDLSSPLYDQTHTGQIPSTWDVGFPQRPVVRAVFDAVSVRYLRFTWARTAGADALTVARIFAGPVVQLSSNTDGVSAYGFSTDVETASEQQTGDLDTDFRFNRSVRRSASIKLWAVPTAKARSEFYAKLAFASGNADSFYCYDPTETDARLVQTETLWGPARFESALTYSGPNYWEATMKITERL